MGLVTAKTRKVSEVLGHAPLVMVQMKSFQPLLNAVADVDALKGLEMIPPKFVDHNPVP